MHLQLEPRPTRQLTVKTDGALIDQIDEAAARFNVTRSHLTRSLLRSGLQQLRKQKQLEGAR